MSIQRFPFDSSQIQLNMTQEVLQKCKTRVELFFLSCYFCVRSLWFLVRNWFTLDNYLFINSRHTSEYAPTEDITVIKSNGFSNVKKENFATKYNNNIINNSINNNKTF